MGPMVVAGVRVHDQGKLIEIEVKDSKRLSSKRRDELEEKIKDFCEFTVRVVSAEDIDSLRKSMTLNALEVYVFANIIDELCGDKDTCYVDSASTDEKKFKNEIEKRLKKRTKVVSEHGADDEYPVVSAASILAKVERDRRIHEISKELDRDIGSGYPSDPKTRDFLKDWISEHGSLPPYTRKSWETSRDLLNKFKTRSLDEF